jgi:hypothetical protein
MKEKLHLASEVNRQDKIAVDPINFTFKINLTNISFPNNSKEPRG